jgi:chaperone modulatory protein CbpM
MTELSFSLPLEELCQLERIDPKLVIEIVEYDIAQPMRGEKVDDWVFDTTTVYWIKKAVRLHLDLEIDWIAVALVIDLMQQKESLLRENERVQYQLKRFIDK